MTAEPAADRRRTGSLRVDGRPLYVQAEQALRDLIHDRGLGPGDRMPSEQELARLLGVSRPTVREALRKLELTGLVRRIHGLGTLVSGGNDQVAAGLDTLESLDAQARREGWTCATVDISLARCQLAGELAERLARPEGTPATRLERTKTRDGRPIAFMESTIPEDVLSPIELETGFHDSIIDMFRTKTDPVVELALTRVRVGAASVEIAKRLKAATGTSLLVLEEVFVDTSGVNVCFNVNSFLPGAVHLDLVRRFP